jgi:hypothetical protein
MRQGRTITVGLAVLLTWFLTANQAAAGLQIYTEGIPNGVPPGGATGVGFGSPVIENFLSPPFTFPGQINMANNLPVSLTGTPLGGGIFQIGQPGGGIANTFRPFAGEPSTTGITLVLSNLFDHSFLATGLPFAALGFRISDVGSGTTDDNLVVTVFGDLAGTVNLGTFTVDLDSVTGELIETNEVAFIGVRQDGAGPVLPFARVDIRLSGLGADSIQFHGFRGIVIPEPSSVLVLLVVAAGLWCVRRRFGAG